MNPAQIARYRNDLPQLAGDLFLTDGGIETTLIFLEGIELPYFASIVLLQNDEGQDALRKYFRTYAVLTKNYGVGCILESATWRASSDWGDKLGYSRQTLEELNCKAIALLNDIRNDYDNTTIVISGCIGPRGDGYSPDNRMTAEEAKQYHRGQIALFSETPADMITAITMPYVEEAIGITSASKSVGIPVVISFTVETDGKLPTGQTLKDAIEQVDKVTDNTPIYYMINCAHPTHFEAILETNDPWIERIRGIRANASTKSHAEIDEATELDDGNPIEFGAQYQRLRKRLKNLNVLGGCCGTDHRHIEEILKACLPPE